MGWVFPIFLFLLVLSVVCGVDRYSVLVIDDYCEHLSNSSNIVADNGLGELISQPHWCCGRRVKTALH